MKQLLLLAATASLAALAACSCDGPRPSDDSRACTPANYCRLVDGAAECEPGHTWLDPDPAANDYRCVPLVDAGLADAGSADNSAADAFTPVDAARRDSAPADRAPVPDGAMTDAGGQDHFTLSDAARADSWIPPTGAPTFDLPYRYPGLPLGYQLLDDINGDGRLDAVQVESFNPYDSLNLRVQLAQAAGGFAPSFTATVAGHAGQIVAVCDFDGDGRPDLLLNSGNRAVSYLFSNLGNGQFSATPEEWSISYSADSFQDFDHNGRCDALELQGAYGYHAGSVTLHLRQSNGSTLDVVLDNLHFGATGVGDVDADGRLDLVLAGTGYPYKLLVYRLQGDNSWQQWGGVIDCADCNDARRIAVRDLDGDGDADVLLGGYDVIIYRNSGTTLAAEAGLGIAHPQALRVDDVDGDSRPDLVVISQPVPTSANHGLEVWYGPAYSDVRRSYNLRGSRRISRVIDHDGDGKRDLILDDDLVYAGLVDRELRAPRLSPWPTAGSGFYYATRFFILDADSVPGLEVASSMRSSLRLAHLGADLRFASESGCSGLFVDNDFPNADLILRDMTGDGRMDLLIGNDQGTHLRVGQGGCSFGADQVLVPSAYASWLDINGDGLLDALWHTSNTLNAALATAAGVYGNAVTSTLTGDYYSYRAARLDGDAHIDLVLLGYETGDFMVAAGDSAGHFVSTGTTSVGVAGTDEIVDILVVDLDGDGDNDLLVAMRGSSARVELLRNDGAAHFTAQQLIADIGGGFDMYLARHDFDGDGSAELWIDQGRAQAIYRLDRSEPPTLLAHLDLEFAWPADVDADGDTDLCFIDDYDGRAIFAVAANRAR